MTEPTFLNEPRKISSGFEKMEGWIKFLSDLSTKIEDNNLVWTKVTESGSFEQVLLVFHHWNATIWSCPAYVPVSQLIYAALRSKAKGLFFTQ